MITAEEIKELRDKLGLTQAQLAYKIEVSVVAISRWENNKSVPSPLAQKAIRELRASLIGTTEG